MRILGLIPARGGSRRIHRKNIVDLDGKPLIAWTIEQAKKSKMFSHIAVSTEDPEIAAVANRWGASVLPRPTELARDDTPMIPVVTHAIRTTPCDVVVLLQPTSPFRGEEDIVRSIELLKSTKGDSVISVTDVPEDMVFEVGHAGRLRETKNFVMPNGAIYAITSESLLGGLDWYSGISYAYKMPKERSLDIDTPLDLEIARTVARLREKAA